MTKERHLHQPPSASEAPLRMQNPVEPLHPRALLEAALSLIEPDGTVIYAKGSPVEFRLPGYEPDDTARYDSMSWSNLARTIAGVLYRNLKPRWEPEHDVCNLACYLHAYQHDPALFQAALLIMGAQEGETFHTPQLGERGDWRAQVLALRQQYQNS